MRSPSGTRSRVLVGLFILERRLGDVRQVRLDAVELPSATHSRLLTEIAALRKLIESGKDVDR